MMMIHAHRHLPTVRSPYRDRNLVSARLVNNLLAASARARVYNVNLEEEEEEKKKKFANYVAR
ncbi:hypothetical protein TYRP_013358 [Tyrophagus putrescentiae]|nr:hypothetical protein TYRP_013358 [Tyrophagus putrescentiae]